MPDNENDEPGGLYFNGERMVKTTEYSYPIYGKSPEDWLGKDTDIWGKREEVKREKIIVLRILLALNEKSLLNFDIDEDTKKDTINALIEIIENGLNKKE